MPTIVGEVERLIHCGIHTTAYVYKIFTVEITVQSGGFIHVHDASN